ncbi:MAG TPA: class I SAM-dependent methyltransferase [Solirubrobacteraceae bacterium]
MSTDYESIAEQYRDSKHAEWRVRIEIPSFMRLVGDVRGKSVLDLACGEGFYSRLLMRQGAARVVGVDNSPAMISLGQTAELREPLGVHYIAEDVRGLDLGEKFDLVAAAFLLNYAPDAAELAEMCRAVGRHLKPGCRFVTVNGNPELGARQIYYRKYGFERLVPAGLTNGSPYIFRNHEGDTSFDITVYQLDVATHERALAAAGMTDVRWVRPEVSAQGIKERDSDYWETFVREPPIILIECRASGS